MQALDWTVLIAYFVAMLGVGVWARTKIKDAKDFFTAGGHMPWWLSGISHHMSGYSSAVFVGYAALAYTFGVSLYIWWAVAISIALFIGARVFAPRWAWLRVRFDVISPLEYLAIRYNVPSQQILAWSGTFLKIFDVGAKWASAAILLNAFAGVPFVFGILLTGGVTLVYSVIGGLWADALTDFSQFLIQIVAGIAMLAATLIKLGGVSALWTMWSQLPPAHAHPFNGSYGPLFALGFLCVSLLSYNGGTWNLAQRFMASPSPQAARRAAWLSATLYLVWPLVLFFPMWAAPLLLPKTTDPQQSYALLTRLLLPNGLVGLVLAGLFAHTMAMTSSDANAISAVFVRDILPRLRGGRKALGSGAELMAGRVSTFAFLALSMVLGLISDRFGGVMGLILMWYAALVGPIAVPMLLGLLPQFRRAGPLSAIAGLAAGAGAFIYVRFGDPAVLKLLSADAAAAVNVAGPTVAAALAYIVFAIFVPWKNTASDALIERIK